MKNILYLAYACEPNAGSEYGVGWNIPILFAAKYSDYNVYVLTRSRCKEKIQKELHRLNLSNLNFFFYDIPKWLFYNKEMGSNWGEQINYLFWQLLARKYIKELNKNIHFDLIHHITFNQYRTPSPGFFINIPFIMGPIGGAETIPSCFYQDLQATTIKKERIRQKGRDLKIFRLWCKAKNNAKYFLFSSNENINRVGPFCNSYPMQLLPAIAFSPNDFPNPNKKQSASNKFKLVYAGKALDWKGILIFLKAIRIAYIQNNITNFSIKLVGIRFEEEQKQVMKWVSDLGLTDYIELRPFIQRNELLKLLEDCNLSVYPAFRDSGSMSVLEASVLGCPTICFNTGGQDAFPDSILLKVDVTDSYEKTLKAFAEKLKWAYDNKYEIALIGEKAQKYVYRELTWEKKVDEFYQIYQNLIK